MSDTDAPQNEFRTDKIRRSESLDSTSKSRFEAATIKMTTGLPGRFFVALMAIVFTVSFFDVSAAQARSICVEAKEQRGSLIFVAKNSSWFVNRAHPPKGSVALWFRRSLISSDMPDLVQSGIQIYPKINPAELLQRDVGEKIKIALLFDRSDQFQFETKIVPKTSAYGPYFILRWTKTLSPEQHADLLEAAKRASSVRLTITDARNTKVLRSTVQSLEGFADVVAEAMSEQKRMLKEQPLGTCSAF